MKNRFASLRRLGILLLSGALLFSCTPKEEAASGTTTIKLFPESLTLSYGQKALLQATVTPAATSILWKSEDESVATVEGGLVTGRNNGSTTIKAVALPSLAVATCAVSVRTIWVEKIDPVRSKLSLIKGETVQLETVITPANASIKTLRYSSSNPAIATVDESGLVTAVKAGGATITISAADDHGARTTLPVLVENEAVNPTSMDVQMDLEMAKNTRQIARLVWGPSNANRLAYSAVSSNPDVLTVTRLDDERLQLDAKGAGTSTLTVVSTYNNSLSKIVEITVHAGAPSVRFKTEEISRFAWNDNVINLSSAAVAYSEVEVLNLNDKSVTFSSADPNIATIETLPSNRCRMRGVAEGTTKFFVTSVASPTHRDTIEVKVWPRSTSITTYGAPEKIYVKHGESTYFYVLLKNGTKEALPTADLDMEWDENMDMISYLSASVTPYKREMDNIHNPIGTKITLTGKAGSGLHEGTVTVKDFYDYGISLTIPVVVCDYSPNEVKPGDIVTLEPYRWYDGGWRGGDYFEKVTISDGVKNSRYTAVVGYASKNAVWESDSYLANETMNGYRVNETTYHGYAICPADAATAIVWANNNTDLCNESDWPSTVVTPDATNHHMADLSKALLEWNATAPAGKKVNVATVLKDYRNNDGLSNYYNSDWVIPTPAMWNAALNNDHLTAVNHSLSLLNSAFASPIDTDNDVRYWLAPQSGSNASFAWYGSCPNKNTVSTSVQNKGVQSRLKLFIVF